MDRILDSLSLTFGRPLPVVLTWVTNIVWWTVFLVAMLSLWPEAYRAFGDFLAKNGIAFSLPSTDVVVPLMIVLTCIQLVHGLAIRRRNELLSG